MTERPLVLVTSRSFGSGDRDLRAELDAAGCDVVTGPADHDLDALREPLARAAAWIAGTGPVTAAHLDAAPELQVVARYGVGVDAVDRTAAARRGVLVANTPGANSEAVADHALALALAVLRGVTAGDRDVRQGNWTATRARELNAMTVGVLGLGRIGRGVARRFAGFGARVIAADPFLSDEAIREAGAEPVPADDLPALADLVSLHAPGGACVVTADWLARAREGAFLVNTARADLVDEAALAAALRSGRLAGYAADTMSAETTHATWDDAGARAQACPLLDPELADRVVLTPHRAAQTVQAVDRMGGGAVAAVLDVLAGRPPATLVPPPEGDPA